MKKVILAVAIAGLALSCQKIQAGGNKGALKLLPETERYTDDVMSDEATAKVAAMQQEKVAADSTSVSTMQTPTMTSDSAKVVAPAAQPATTENN